MVREPEIIPYKELEMFGLKKGSLKREHDFQLQVYERAVIGKRYFTCCATGSEMTL